MVDHTTVKCYIITVHINKLIQKPRNLS